MGVAISVKIDQNVAWLAMNRPPANGYNLDILTQLVNNARSIEADDNVKVVVLKSGIDKFFCAGADIKDFAANSSVQNAEMAEKAREFTGLIASSTKVYIAAIAGHCLGGGLEFALACDIRVAANGRAKFGLPEVKLGLIPGDGGAARLIHLIGAGKAVELLLTGDSIDAERAYKVGILNHLYSSEDFEAKLHEYVANLSNGAGTAMAAIKQFSREQSGLTLEQSLQLEKKIVGNLYGTHDAEEGFNAFIEKRKPKFK